MIHLLDLPQSGAGLALVRALGWTLLHFCSQGVVIAAALWCVLGMIGARFSRARYAAACVALALMVALPAATLFRLAKTELAASRAMATLPALVFDVTAVDSGNAAPVPLKERAKEALERAVPWVPAVWIAGVVLFLGRLSLGMAGVRRMRSVAAEPMPETYEEVFREMARRLGVARAVELMHSAVVEVPTVIGWLRPMVLVPVGCFTGLSPVQIEALLAHELAHIRRHDYLVSVCQSVVEALLFYHPAVWWVSRQVRRERECCCDELAIAASGDVLAYARALSWLEQQRSAMPEIALGANGGVLTMRIRRMLGYREGPVVSLPVMATVTLVMLAAVGTYFGEVAHAQRKAAILQQVAATVDAASPGDGAGHGFGMSWVPQKDAPAVMTGAAVSRTDWFDDSRIDSKSKQTIVWFRMGWAYILPSSLEFHEGETIVPNNGLLAGGTFGIPAQHVAPRKDAIGLLQFLSQITLEDGTIWKADHKQIEAYYKRKVSQSMAENTGHAKLVTVAQEGSVSSTLAPVYKTWLTQDVRWIITDAEKAAFQQLTNDDERDDFIKNFWARRDPPGAPAGTFKQEHFARVAYANEHFATDKQAGWSTDRGHTYIAYGKPDSIDSHPGATPYPYEVWHYRSIPGVSEGDVSLTFINGPGGSSEYRISIDGANTQGSAKPENRAGRPIAMPVRLQDQQRAAAVQAGGTIEGVVVDPTGAVVPRATVTATNTATGAPVSFTTDNTGKFSFAALPPAAYSVDVAARGFQKLHQENVRVGGDAVTLGLKLSVGAATESLTVHPQNAGGPSAAAGRSTAPMLVSGGVMAQQATFQPAPAYPPIAKAAHVQGAVVLHAIVSQEGRVENLQVISGAPMLTSSAMDAVKSWTYKPYLLNGRPVAVDTIVTVHFTLPPESAATAGEPVAAAAVRSHGPIRVSSGVAAGMAISQVQPVYPEEAKAAHVQGVVVLHAVISKGGEVENLQAVSGPKELVGSAIDAVRQWRYSPYLLNGEPTEVETTINVNYTLDETTTDHSLYDTGIRAMAKGQYEAARLAMQTLINAYPDSPFVQRARQTIDESWKKQGQRDNGSTPTASGGAAPAAIRKTGGSVSTQMPNPTAGLPIRIVFAPKPATTLRASFVPPVPVKSTAEETPTDAAGNPLRRIGGNVSPPLPIYEVEPEFTPEARAAKVGAIVIVGLVVNENGRPENVHIVRGQLDDKRIDAPILAGLEGKALEAVQQYRFRPAMENGQPVPVSLNIEVNLKMF